MSPRPRFRPEDFRSRLPPDAPKITSEELAEHKQRAEQFMQSPEGKAMLRKMRRSTRWTDWTLILVTVLLFIVAVPFLLLLLPFRALPSLYARNVRARADGLSVYTLLGGECARYDWNEIEAFWIFDTRRYDMYAPREWQLVLKNRRCIPLPLARGKTIWSICKAQGIPTNLWTDEQMAGDTAAAGQALLLGGRWLF